MTTKQNKKENLIPLSDRALIKESAKADTKTAGGIIIPESVKEVRGAKKGIVVAVGKGKMEEGKLIPMSVKVGDQVLFNWSDEITIDGEKYSLVRDSEILAIIK